MSESSTLFVGLDVHKDSIGIATAIRAAPAKFATWAPSGAIWHPWTRPCEFQIVGTFISPEAGTRLVWHALADGRLFVRVKNKSVMDLTGMLTPPKGKHVSIEEMRP